jgi:ABC-type dipeptide/oligopeptide/nickel transport system permease component
VLNFAFRRLIGALPVLLLVAVIIFTLVRAIPGDPAVALLGEGASNQQVAALRAQLHLDDSFLVQFVRYFGNLLQGNLGNSLRTNRPISEELLLRLPATIELSLTALFFAVLVGVPLGILSAVWANRPFDHISRLISLIGVSAPVFWLALVLQVVFSIHLDLLPVSGRLDIFLRPPRVTGFLLIDGLILGQPAVFWSALRHLLLPAGVLAAFLAATIARLIRASMLEELRQDYVRTAWAKGLNYHTVLLVHVLRNSLIPTITITGLKFAELLGGAILTETVFAWPGMGRYMFEAIKNRDYPVIQGATLLFALVFILSSLLVDLLYGLLNPRIRTEA